MRGATDFMADIAAMIRKQVMDAVPTFRWATVTSVNPLRIRFDGETDPLPITPDTLVNPPVGARVFVLHWMRRVTVLGRAGGVPDTGWVEVPLRSGFSGQAGIVPAVRRIGDTVHWSWGISNAGLTASATHSVADIPVGFRPNSTRSEYYGAISSNSAAAQGSIIVYQSGLVLIRTPATVGQYYIASFSYTLDPE